MSIRPRSTRTRSATARGRRRRTRYGPAEPGIADRYARLVNGRYEELVRPPPRFSPSPAPLTSSTRPSGGMNVTPRHSDRRFAHRHHRRRRSRKRQRGEGVSETATTRAQALTRIERPFTMTADAVDPMPRLELCRPASTTRCAATTPTAWWSDGTTIRGEFPEDRVARVSGRSGSTGGGRTARSRGRRRRRRCGRTDGFLLALTGRATAR